MREFDELLSILPRITGSAERIDPDAVENKARFFDDRVTNARQSSVRTRCQHNLNHRGEDRAEEKMF